MNYSKVKNGYEIYSNGNLNEFKIWYSSVLANH
jgi:hypothetical protein